MSPHPLNAADMTSKQTVIESLKIFDKASLEHESNFHFQKKTQSQGIPPGNVRGNQPPNQKFYQPTNAQVRASTVCGCSGAEPFSAAADFTQSPPKLEYCNGSLN